MTLFFLASTDQSKDSLVQHLYQTVVRSSGKLLIERSTESGLSLFMIGSIFSQMGCFPHPVSNWQVSEYEMHPHRCTFSV